MFLHVIPRSFNIWTFVDQSVPSNVSERLTAIKKWRGCANHDQELFVKYLHLLAQIISDYPNRVDAYTLRSQIYSQQGQWYQALLEVETGFQIYLSLFPDQEIPEGAKVVYNDANSHFYEALWWLIVCYLNTPTPAPAWRSAYLTEALGLSKTLLSIDINKSTNALYLFIECALELQDYKAIIQHTHKHWKNSFYPDCAYNRALAHFALNRPVYASKVLYHALLHDIMKVENRDSCSLAEYLLDPSLTPPYNIKTGLVGRLPLSLQSTPNTELVPQIPQGDLTPVVTHYYQHWQQVPGALDWLNSQRPQIESIRKSQEDWVKILNKPFPWQSTP